MKNGFRKAILTYSVILFLQPLFFHGQPKLDSLMTDSQTAPKSNGQHDFIIELESWKTNLISLVHPLTGSSACVENTGTPVVKIVWNGFANLVEQM